MSNLTHSSTLIFGVQALNRETQNPKPIFGITRIDKAWMTYFYFQAWALLAPPNDSTESKTARRRIIARLSRDFKNRCKQAGIKVGRGAVIKYVLEHIYFGHSKGIMDYWLAKELLDLFLDVPVQYHSSLMPYVKLKVSRCNRDYDWQLTTKGTGEK